MKTLLAIITIALITIALLSSCGLNNPPGWAPTPPPPTERWSAPASEGHHGHKWADPQWR